MAGYTRQSAADIVPTAVVRAAPINNELNALRDAFDESTGHTHDGTAAEGALVPLIADADGNNAVEVDTSNNRIGVFVEVSTAPVEQVRFQDGAIVPVTDDDIDLGSSGAEFKNLFIDGTANIDSLVADTADINAGTIDGAVIGGASAQAITGTLITATTGFSGPITGNVTGDVTGNVTGNITGNVTGNLTGNVTATSGSSEFNNVVIRGTLDMDGATAATIINLASPTNTGDAATKGYVDTADNLKLNLSGGTMSGNIAMGNNKVTGLGTPTSSGDAATKDYVDTAITNLVDSAPGALDTLNELAAALGDDANFSTTVTNALAGKLSLTGGTMTGAIAMGTSKITGLGAPTDANDAATKTYVDTADATKLNLSGGTMTGAIAMGTNKITGLGAPTNSADATTKTYVDTADATKLSLSGGTMTGAIAMGTNAITGMADPTNAQDAATKNYIDTLFGSTTAAAASAAAAAISESNAAISESNAAGSASSAATSANNAAASYDSFDDRYLGPKGSDPAVDNDGDPLLTGALYFNTSANEMRIWTGSVWLAAYISAAGYLALTGGTMTGDITFSGTQTFPGTLVTGDIGVTVQGYDADTAKYDDTTANFTGTLQNNGSPVLVDSDVGVTVQAYDSNLTSFVGTFTLPTTDGTNGQVLQTNGSGALSFGTVSGGGGGGITYSRKTTTYTAVADEGIIADTSGGAWTLTLPATPSEGDTVVVVDGANWNTNNLTVARNGSTIEGLSEDLILDVAGTSVQFIYDSSTWQVYTKIGFNNPVPFATVGKAIAAAIVFG